MMMKSFIDWSATAGLALALLASSGCATTETPDDVATPHAVITRTKLPIQFDGNLSDAAWALTPSFALERIDNYSGMPPREARCAAADRFEPAFVKFLYDDQYLYIGCALSDSDVTNYKKQDQEMLFRYGDLLEIFLKPAHANHYWELYAAPNNAKASFFYPSGGLLGVDEFFTLDKLMKGLEVSVRVAGTLNKHDDQDNSWTVEMRIPLSELDKAGVKFGPENAWTVMVSRYNYSAGLYTLQPSSFPQMPTFGYHSRQYYAPVDFR